MKVEFRNKTMQKICEDASIAERKYGLKMALKIQQRIDEIKAADSVEMMLKYRIDVISFMGIETINLLWI